MYDNAVLFAIIFLCSVIYLIFGCFGKQRIEKGKLKEMNIENGYWEQISKNRRLRHLVKKAREYDNVPKASGPGIHNDAPDLGDPRRPTGAKFEGNKNAGIILMGKEYNKDGCLLYGRADSKTELLKGKELADKIKENKAEYLAKGPPYIKDMKILDMVAVDSFPRYLFNLYIIDEDEYFDMEDYMKIKFPRIFLDLEYGLLTKNTEKFADEFTLIRELKNNYFNTCKDLMDELDPADLKEHLLRETNPDIFRLFWLEKKFSKYVNNFKLEPCHLLRIPLQGLLMLLIQDDLSADMAWKLLITFRLVSFSLIRSKEVVQVNKHGAVMYPMNCMLKLTEEHEFPKLSDYWFSAIVQVLAKDPVKHDNDWEIVF